MGLPWWEATITKLLSAIRFQILVFSVSSVFSVVSNE